MKKLILAGTAIIGFTAVSSAAVAFTGFSVLNLSPAGVAPVLYIQDDDGDGFGALTSDLTPDTPIPGVGGLLEGDTILGTSGVTGGSFVQAAGVSFDLGGVIAGGKNFAVLVFATQTVPGQASAGDSYNVYTNTNWQVPGSDGSFGFTAGATSAGSPFSTVAAPAATDAITVVPEPSTALLGLLAGLGFVARRRRN